MYVAPGFSHACSAFAVSLFLWIWLRVRDTWTPLGALSLGASAALMAMVREQDAFFAAGPALDFLFRGASPPQTPLRALSRGPGEPRSSRAGSLSLAFVRTAAAGITAAVLVYLPQLFAYNALNGHPGPTLEVSRKMTWWSPHALEVMWSPQHGLFFWTPIALVALGGLIWLAAGQFRTARPETAWIASVMIIMVALQIYVSGCVESWTVAGSFGQRRLVALTPILALGLAVWTEKVMAASRPRMAWTCLVALLVWWNVGLMAQFGLHLMDRQRLTLGRNARMTFVELPQEMPSLVVRYFTDRTSFYRQPRQD
jgi:hypothetical protein